MSKPDALELADRLEGRWALHPEMQQAAAELRRLHAENESLRFALSRIAGRCDAQAAYKIALEALEGQA